MTSTPDPTTSGTTPGSPDGVTILHSLPRAIAAADLGGRITFWNSRATELTGRESAEVMGRSLVGTIVRDDDTTIADSVLADVARGKHWDGDLLVEHHDGTVIRITAAVRPLREDAGTISGIVVSAEDVTARREFELRAGRTAEQLNLALSAGHLGTWRWDRDTDVVTWDETLETVFGLPPGGFDGTFATWMQLVHPDDRDDVDRTVSLALADASPYRVEHRIVRPDGTLRWILGQGTATTGLDGEVTGTIGVAADITDRKMLELHADQRAAEAERLAEVEHLQRRRLEFLSGIHRAALSSPDHRTLMSAVARAAVPGLGDWCAITFFPEPGAAPELDVAHADPAKVEWAVAMRERYEYDPDAERGVPAVIRSGRTEFIPSFDASFVDEMLASRRSADADEIRGLLEQLALTSMITVPLRHQRGIIGAIQFVSAESGRAYDHDDVALAEAAAGPVAQALARSWFGEQQRAIAATLQSALLPRTLPEVDEFDVVARYWAAGTASEVGGDFYDVFPIGERRWALVIGDVCGTGPEAASITAVARHTVRAAAMHGAGPVDVITWLDDAIHAANTDRYCTVLYATLEPADGDTWLLTVVAGGHPLPLVARAGVDGAPPTVEEIGVHGTLVGLLPVVEVTPTSTVLHVGDTLVLYTDGLTDVSPPHAMDQQQVIEMVADASATGGDASGLADHLGRQIERHLALRERDDDIALVALRIVTGPGAPA